MTDTILHHPTNEYHRDLDFVKHYIKDAATYAAIMNNIDYATAEAAVKKIISPTGAHPLFDPRVLFLDSTKPGYRDKKQTTMLGYTQSVTENRFIMAATFTCYQHPDVRESPSARYIKSELDNRNKNKGQMHHHSDLANQASLKIEELKQNAAPAIKIEEVQREQAQNSSLSSIYKNRQNRNKIKCNSVSGGHGTRSSVLFQQTAHSTLTSTCRSAASNISAMLEKFITGNRHYFSADALRNNIISIINITDLDLVQKTMDHYKLVWPTVDQVHAHLKRSSDLYWRSEEEHERISVLLHRLEPVQLAAVYYVGDLYALKELNEDFVRKIFTVLVTMPGENEKIADPKSWIDKLSSEDIGMLGITANEILHFHKLTDEKILGNPKKGIPGDAIKIERLGAAAKNIVTLFQDIKLLSDAFWTTKNMPLSMARFPTSIRKTVIASDTDSTIFTTQDWTEWFVGQLDFSDMSASVAAATTCLCSKITQHVLMQMMANFGAAERHITEYQMKNEFYFKFFALTNMAKHYFAARSAQEGLVFEKPKWEIKGAQLKNSNAPAYLVDRAEEEMKKIASLVLNNEEIDVHQLLKDYGLLEWELFKKIRNGDVNFFARTRIKPRSSYSDTKESSPYDHYTLWSEVFAPKYGECSEPPYDAIRVNVELSSVTKLNDWLDFMPDQALAIRFREWQARYNKKQLTSFILPTAIVNANGIPSEIVDIMDIRGMVFKQMRTFYLLLETLCVFMISQDNTRMLSDFLPAELKAAV